MRDGLKIEKIKRLGNNLKSLTITGDNKSVEIKKLGNIETFFERNNFMEFLKKGNFSSDGYLFKVDISLILNGEKEDDDVDDTTFYIIGKDNRKEVFLTNEIDINKTNLSYNFELYPYTDEFGIGKKSLGNVVFEGGKINLFNFNKETLIDGVLEYIYDLYQVD